MKLWDNKQCVASQKSYIKSYKHVFMAAMTQMTDNKPIIEAFIFSSHIKDSDYSTAEI